jgi:DNA polymerase I-like protein with 3'-5' exonuclease and polymerase domains
LAADYLQIELRIVAALQRMKAWLTP